MIGYQTVQPLLRSPCSRLSQPAELGASRNRKPFRCNELFLVYLGISSQQLKQEVNTIGSLLNGEMQCVPLPRTMTVVLL